MKGVAIASMMIGLLVACPVASQATQESDSSVKYTLSLTKAYIPSEWTAEPTYMSRSGQKLVFGGKNTLLGWMELYNEPKESIQDNRGFFRGMGRGLANMTGDTIGGVLHVATFPITALDVALPEGGTDLL